MKEKYIIFKGYTYVIDLTRLREVCLIASGDIGSKEVQIVQTYDVSDIDTIGLSQKIEHETKTLGGNINAMIYELIKLMVITLIENNDTTKDFEPTFGMAFAINTLVDWGVLKKID